jgi:hypothetical protein
LGTREPAVPVLNAIVAAVKELAANDVNDATTTPETFPVIANGAENPSLSPTALVWTMT